MKGIWEGEEGDAKKVADEQAGEREREREREEVF